MRVYVLNRKSTDIHYIYSSVTEFESDMFYLSQFGDGKDLSCPEGFEACATIYHKYNPSYLCVPNKKGFVEYAQDRLRANQ